MRVRMRVPMVIMHSIMCMHVHGLIVTTETPAAPPLRLRHARAPQMRLTSVSTGFYHSIGSESRAQFQVQRASTRPAQTARPSMANTTTKVTFWGVRGSTPTPERGTWRYGGNTACVEVVTGDGTRFILDCGTGMRLLGNRWEEQAGHRAIEAHILVTHYHWDHIQGIPFFHPFFQQQNRFHFYSFESKYLGPNSLRKVLEAQMASPYFPVDVSMLTAGREYREEDAGEQFEINGTRVTTRWLNHPQGCLGYRLDTPGGSVVYATDNEPGVPEFDENLRQLAAGADVLICDAQCSPEQLATTGKGWGHSSWLECVKLARHAKASNLFLFNH